MCDVPVETNEMEFQTQYAPDGGAVLRCLPPPRSLLFDLGVSAYEGRRPPSELGRAWRPYTSWSARYSSRAKTPLLMTDRTLFCVPPGMRLPHYAAGATLAVEYEVREGRNVLAHVPTVRV